MTRLPVILAALVAAATLTTVAVTAAEPDAAAIPAAAVSSDTTPSATPEPTPTPTAEPTEQPDCRGARDTRTDKSEPFTVCGIPVISKAHRVNATYKPHLVTVHIAKNGLSKVRLQPAAGTNLKALFAAAKKAGHTLVVRYAYRSYAWQKAAYKRDHVLTAPAGGSEHQSGLAIDLAAIKHGKLIRGFAFGTSSAGKWVKAHGASYGFIVRYPNGQKAITGITYEPWHLRYIGVEAAQGVTDTPTRTLERYLQIG